jgi:hypothetical protein
MACGGQTETVTEGVPVMTTTTPTSTDIQVGTDDDSGGASEATDGSDDSGGYDEGAGTCPEGEVLSAPGNKCRPADDSDDGQ